MSPRSEANGSRQGSVVWRTLFTSGDCVWRELVRDKARVRYDSSAIIEDRFRWFAIVLVQLPR